MILFGVNFNVYFLIFTKNIKDALRCEEARIYMGIIGVSVLLISVNTCSMFSGVGETVRHVAFQVASIITTTGFPQWTLSCGRNFHGLFW